MDRDELKALIRTEPTKQATLADLVPDLVAAESHAAALRDKHDSLVADLRDIESAKARLESLADDPSQETDRESGGDVADADNPTDNEED